MLFTHIHSHTHTNTHSWKGHEKNFHKIFQKEKKTSFSSSVCESFSFLISDSFLPHSRLCCCYNVRCMSWSIWWKQINGNISRSNEAPNQWLHLFLLIITWFDSSSKSVLILFLKSTSKASELMKRLPLTSALWFLALAVIDTVVQCQKMTYCSS